MKTPCTVSIENIIHLKIKLITNKNRWLNIRSSGSAESYLVLKILRKTMTEFFIEEQNNLNNIQLNIKT